MVSNGAFVLKEWVPGSHVLAVRNHHYWNDRATQLEAVKYPADHGRERRAHPLPRRASCTSPPSCRAANSTGSRRIWRASCISLRNSTPIITVSICRARPSRTSPACAARSRSSSIAKSSPQRVLRVGELPAYGWVPPGVHDYTPQSFDYRATPLPQRIARSAAAVCCGRLFGANPLALELRYNDGEIHTKLAIAVASMWKEALGVQDAPRGGGVQIAAAGYRPGRRGALSLKLGGRLQRRLHFCCNT